MFQSVRKRALGLVTKAFLFLIVLSFALWGVGDVVRGAKRTDVAAVGKQRISLAEYDQEYRAASARYREMLGKDASPEMLEKLGVKKLVIDNLVTRALITQEIQSLGLRVPDEAVATQIAKEPAFQDKDGTFSKARFEQVLRQIGQSEAGFVDAEKRELARQFLLETLRTATPEPGKMTDFLLGYRLETRDITVLRLLPSAVSEAPVPSEEEVAQFHREHQAQFTAPEYRDFTWLIIGPEMFAENAEVTEAELREEYEAHKAEFATPEKRQILQALFPDEAAAKAAVENVKKGKGTTDLGAIAQSDLPEKSLGDAVFSTKVGNITAPLKSAFGWHVFKVTKIIPGKEQTFEEAKETVRKKLAATRGADLAFKAVSRVEDAIAGGATLEEVAKQFNAKTQAIGRVERTGRRADGVTETTLPLFAETLPVAFATEEKETSSVTQGPDNRFFVVHVDGVTPARNRTLEEVRGSVITAWQAAKKRETLLANAKEAREALAKGGSVGDLRARYGQNLDVKTYASLGRGAQEKGLSPTLADAAFTLALHGVSEPMAEEDGVSFATVTAIHPGKANDAERAKLAEELRNQYASEQFGMYLDYLRGKYNVELYPLPGDSL